MKNLQGIRRFIFILSVAILILMGECTPKRQQDFSVTHLRCEYRVDPIGMDVLNPILSRIHTMMNQRLSASKLEATNLCRTTRNKQ